MIMRRMGSMSECEARTQGAFVAVGYGRDRGRRIVPLSGARRPLPHSVRASTQP